MRRRLLLVVFSVICVAFLTTAAPALPVIGIPAWIDGAEVEDAGSERSSTTADSSLYLPLVLNGFPPRGTAMGVQYYGSVGPSTGFDHFAVTNAGWVRMPVHWSQIEPVNTTPDNYQWPASLDTSILNITRAGKEVILTISGQPKWAAEYAAGPLYDNDHLVEFISALVERYNGNGLADAPGSSVVRYFELYNEPDNTDPVRAAHGGWGYWGYRGTEYATLMKQVYPVIKAANPEAQLVMGGIALDWFVDEGGIFDRGFLDDVLRACSGHPCFDYANFHYYPPFYHVWAPYGEGIVGKTNFVRQKLAHYGMGYKPVMVTELGWVSNEASWGKSEELQARYAVQGFVRGFSVDLTSMIWFKADDSGLSEDPGLLDVNLEPKPAYEAFRTTSRMLAGATFERVLSAAEKGGCPIEGYVIRRGTQRIDVVWTTDSTPFDASDDPSCQYRAHTGSLTKIDKLGNEVTRLDADDGVVDGYVTVWVGGSPSFLVYP